MELVKEYYWSSYWFRETYDACSATKEFERVNSPSESKYGEDRLHYKRRVRWAKNAFRECHVKDSDYEAEVELSVQKQR